MQEHNVLQSVTSVNSLDIIGGNGAELYDSQGNTYLDFNEISIVLGQNNRHFIERMNAKLNSVTSGKVSNSPEKKKLYGYLSETTGNRYRYIHMTSSGSEATEWAVRMALKMSGRNEVVSFWNSIHGRTYLSGSMSGMEIRKQGYAPAAPGVIYGVYPDCHHCPFDKKCESCDFFCLRFLDEKIKYESSREIGAVIIEGYQGAGIIVPPKGWLKALEKWAHDHGAIFILDDIQSGMGRTGQMYSFIEEGLDPDMLILGKALGNGLHVGTILTKDVPDDFYRIALAGGAGDDELTCAAGCAVFEELLENDLLSHISKMGKYIEEKLLELKEKHHEVKNISCRGLACSIEIDNKKLYEKIILHLRENGILTGRGANNKIVLRPPYVITKDQIDKLITVLGKAMQRKDKE